MSKNVCDPINNQAGEHSGWMIWCPGCKMAHIFDGRWEFNGDRVKPTFDGSYLQHKSPNGYIPRCHSFVKDGKIQFLRDCDHDMAGQIVDLKPFDDI